MDQYRYRYLLATLQIAYLAELQLLSNSVWNFFFVTETRETLLKIAETIFSKFPKFPGKSINSIVSGQWKEMKSFTYGLTFHPALVLPLIWAHNELLQLANGAENYTFWQVFWQLKPAQPAQVLETPAEYIKKQITSQFFDTEPFKKLHWNTFAHSDLWLCLYIDTSNSD